MKNGFIKKSCSVLLALILCLTTVSVLADTATIEVDGSVVNTAETPITAIYTGTLETLNVREGGYVKAGDTIATLKTTKVYATEDGTVRLFGSVGDSASMITTRYGAVAYVEPAVQYTISASTRNAYDSEETKIIHPGEMVYLRGNSTLSDVGTGMVTTVSGSNYTVEVLDGNLESNETVNVYRDAEYTTSLRIGRGSTSRVEYTAYEGSGIIVSYNVENGSQVKKGDILFETIEGEYAGSQTDLTAIKAPADGVIGTLSATLGAAVNAGDTICTLYPDDSMRVEAAVNEEFLSVMTVGTDVQIHFTYVGGGEYTVGGTVEQVSANGYIDEESESDEKYFKTIVTLNDITDVSYGMTVTVVK